MHAAVTLKQLRYLVAVADALHFGRAAEACNVSQPSLSAQIQQLEDALGARLLERTARRVMLTPAGMETVARARRILAEVRDLTDGVRGAAAPLAGDLRLGVIPTVGPWLLPRVLPELRDGFPGLRLYLREDRTEHLIERLKAGGLDLLLLALPVEDPGLEAVALYDEEFRIAVPAGHPLASKAALTERDLAGERLLLLEEGHCLREQALAVCGRTAPRERESFAATSLDTLREMVASRIGITLLPALACAGASTPGDGIAVRPFAAPAPTRRIGLVWRKGAARETEFRLLGQFLERHLPAGAGAVGKGMGAEVA